MKPICQRPYQNPGEESIPGLTNQFSSLKSSLPFGASRRHLKSSNSSIFFKEQGFAPKTFWQSISDLPFYLVLILTAGLVMSMFWGQVRETTENYNQFANLVSEKLREELHSNPEFAQLIKDEIKVNKAFARRMGVL